MFTMLAITGGTVVILGAVTKIPPAAAAFLRACIPLITAIHDLLDAIRRDYDDQASVERGPDKECLHRILEVSPECLVRDQPLE